jgi:hypothetical protein
MKGTKIIRIRRRHAKEGIKRKYREKERRKESERKRQNKVEGKNHLTAIS